MKNLSDIIDALILLSLSNREAVNSSSRLKAVSPMFFKVHFCTVRCDAGKGTGKTHYVMDALRQARRPGEVVVIVPDEKHKSLYSMHGLPTTHVHTVFEIMNGRVKPQEEKPLLVFVDDCGRINRNVDPGFLYGPFMSNDPTQTFVFLGGHQP